VYASIARDMLLELGKVDNFAQVNIAKYYSGVDESTPPGRLMAMHMCLEMMLCHPRVVYDSAAKYLLDRPEGSEYAYLLSVSEDFCDIPLSSQKLEVLKTKLAIILEDPAAKVLIYSKYKFMLEVLRQELPYSSVTFTGDMSAREKDNAKKKFTEDADIRLFFSSYAGGYGLDMNMATHLINYDLPWSFGVQDQINNRHVRASSFFGTVYVHNLITENSIEERKLRMLERKRRMSELAIDGASGDASVALDQDFLRSHLTFFLETLDNGQVTR
jgi:SNF2 family DNA or RNA helicase